MVLVSQFLTKSESKARHDRSSQPDGSPSRSSSAGLSNHYVVPSHWDLTPANRKPLDCYVTDSFVGAAIYGSMSLESNSAYSTFGADYPADARYFFSGPPYCAVAVTEFGYPNPSRFRLDDDDDGPITDDERQGEGEGEDDGSGKGKGKERPAVQDYFGDCSE